MFADVYLRPLSFGSMATEPLVVVLERIPYRLRSSGYCPEEGIFYVGCPGDGTQGRTY